MTAIDRSTVLKEALKYQNVLTGYAYAMLKDWASAKDAVQDALVTIAEKWDQYDPKYGMYGWFRRIVLSKAGDIRRKRAREVQVEDEELFNLLETGFQEDWPEDKALDYEARVTALRECMSETSGPVQVLLVGYYWQRRSCVELARAMKRSADAVRMTLSRVRQRLRDCVERRLSLAGEGSR